MKLEDETRNYIKDFIIFLVIVSSTVIFTELYYFKVVENISFIEKLLTYIYFIIPIFSVSLFISYVYRNNKNIKTGRLKASFRYRLTLAFIFIAILPSVPLFVFSSKITGKIVEIFYGVNIPSALDSSKKIIINLEKQEIEKTRGRADALLFELTQKGGGINFIIKKIKDLRLEKDYYIAIIQNNNVILENESLNFRIKLEEFKKNQNYEEYIHYSINKIYYFIKVHTLEENKSVILGKRILNGQEKEAFTILETYNNYHKTDLAKGNLPDEIRIFIGIITIGAFLLSILFSFIFARRVSKPIIELAKATKKVSAGNLEDTLNIKVQGEMKILVDSFNQMLRDLNLKNEQLVHSQRIAAWKEVAQGMAHEIKNPLTPIQLSAERIQRNLLKKDQSEMKDIIEKGTEMIIRQVKLLEHFINEFSEFARLPSPILINQSLNTIIEETVRSFEITNQIKIKLELDENLFELFLDRNLIVGLLNNLLKNSLEAIYKKRDSMSDPGFKGKILITTKKEIKNIRKFVYMIIEDNGNGVPEELREKIFKLYFSTKNEHSSGIGLAIVQKTVIEHNGQIKVESSKLGGSKFIISFLVK